MLFTNQERAVDGEAGSLRDLRWAINNGEGEASRSSVGQEGRNRLRMHKVFGVGISGRLVRGGLKRKGGRFDMAYVECN